MSLKFSKNNPLSWLYLGGALLILIAIYMWCAKVSVNPERVFWGTIEQGLTSKGVTIESEQSRSGTSAKQIMRYSLGANNLSQSVTTLTQQGTVVKNEMIATPTTDYTRYVYIKTDQKKANGSPIDFSKLIGVWAKGQEGGGQFFAQSVFGTSLPIGGMGVPIGNVSPEARAALIKQIKADKAYDISFDKTKKHRTNGRLVYTYEATVRPSAYVSLMKKFAQSVGLHGLDQLNPDDYKSQKPFHLTIVVDAYAKQVTSISTPDSDSKQAYTNYGVPVQTRLPKNPITSDQLQQLLSALQ